MVSEDRRDEALHDVHVVVVVTDSIMNGDNNIEQVSSNSHQYLYILEGMGEGNILNRIIYSLIYPLNHPSIHPPIHQSSIHQPIHLSIYIHPSTRPPVHQPIHPPIHQPTHPPIHQPTHPSVHPSIHPSIHLLLFTRHLFCYDVHIYYYPARAARAG